MTPDHLTQSPDRQKLVVENRELANLGYGLDHPGDLRQALDAIRRKVSPAANRNISDDEIAYTLGHDVVTQVWSARGPKVLTPFAGLSHVFSQGETVKNVVQIGCPSRGSLLAGKNFLAQVGLASVPRTIVDISPLAVKRLQLSCANEATFVLGDASFYPLDEFRPDLVITDMLFSQPNWKMDGILENIARCLPDNGLLLTRVCVISDTVIADYLRLMDLAGIFWGNFCRDEFGADADERDRYLGLTPEQWKTFGELYAYHVRQNYIFPNRFESREEVVAAFSCFPDLKLEVSHCQEQPLGSSSISFLSLALRKTPHPNLDGQSDNTL